MPDPVSAIIGSTIGSAASNIFGAQKGADAINEATDKANAQSAAMLQKGLDTQRSYFREGNDLLKPLAQKGGEVYGELVDQLPDLTAPIVMDQATLEATPGYKFNVDQGIRGIDLSSVARGMSGAQAKAAAQFAVNTANTLYKDQFDIANTNKTNAFNRLLSTAQLGADAGKSIASNATSAGNQALSSATGTGKVQSENTMTGGKAQAGADVATGANIGNAISGVTGAYLNRNRLQSMYG